MTSGNDRSHSNGRNSALKMPSNNDAVNNPVMLSHSIPGTIFAATITATVLMSQRCKKLFSEPDIPLFLNAPCACGEPSDFMTGNTRRHFRIENPVLKTAQQTPNSRGAKGRVSIQRIPAFLESLRLFLGVMAPSLFNNKALTSA